MTLLDHETNSMVASFTPESENEEMFKHKDGSHLKDKVCKKAKLTIIGE